MQSRKFRNTAAITILFLLVGQVAMAQQLHTLFGIVEDSSGQKVQGVSVNVVVENSQLLTDTTDANGAWVADLGNLKDQNGDIQPFQNGDSVSISATSSDGTMSGSKTHTLVGVGTGFEDTGALTIFPPPPIAPTLNDPVVVSSSQVDLSWTDNSNNESNFIVERDSGAGFVQIANLPADTTTHSDTTNLTPDTTYTYRVKAVNIGGEGTSNTRIITTLPPPITIPSDPSGFTATTISDSGISLSWQDSSDNEDNFEVERDDGSGFAPLITVDAGITSYNNIGLQPNTTYTYRVRATNAAGPSSFSNEASATTQSPPVTIPSNPSSLVATTTSSTSINLSWADNSSDETTFKIERKVGNGAFALLITLGTDITSHSDTNLTPNTVYTYRVKASNTAGDSAFSGESLATTLPPPATAPTAPSSFVATAVSGNQINLSWQDDSDNEDEFKVERDSGSGFAVITTLPADTTSYNNTGLQPSTLYTYKVKSVNTAGEGVSAEKSATTQPPPITIPSDPSGLSATAVSSSQIDLSWTDNSDDEDGFKVERKVGNGTFVSLITLGADVTSYNDIGLTPNTVHTYRVQASNTAGDSAFSGESLATTPPSAVTPVTIPNSPSSLTASPLSTSQLRITWQDNSDNEVGFKIERRTSSGNFVGVTTVSANTTQYVNSGLSSSTTYFFRVRASGSDGTSDFSNEASATTKSPTPPPNEIVVVTVPPPSAPQQLKVNFVDGKARLTWLDVSDVEDGIRVDRRRKGELTFTVLDSLARNTSEYTDLAFEPNVEFFYKVVTFNDEGNAGSDEAPAFLDTIPPSAITDLELKGPVSLVTTVKINNMATAITSVGWTAITDKGSEISEYDFRKSTSPITEENFGGLEKNSVSPEVTLNPVHLLLPDTTYFFAIKAIDGAGNISNISNVVEIKTPKAPKSLLLTLDTNEVYEGQDVIVSVQLRDEDEKEVILGNSLKVNLQAVPQDAGIFLRGEGTDAKDVAEIVVTIPSGKKSALAVYRREKAGTTTITASAEEFPDTKREFAVKSAVGDVTISSSHAKVGDVVTITAAGKPGEKATFSVGNIITDQVMTESTDKPGTYTGKFTVLAGQSEETYNVVIKVGDSTLTVSDDKGVTIDNTAPTLTDLSVDQATIRNGQPLVLSIIGESGLSVSADVSNLDTTQTKPIILTESDARQGLYRVEMVVSEENTAEDGVKIVILSATDGAGNVSKESILTVELRNQTGFTLSLSEGLNLIHLPLKVTEVNSVKSEVRTTGDLYNILGEENVRFVITRDTSLESWRSYLGNLSRDTVSDLDITDYLGLLAVMEKPVTLHLAGDPLGTDGKSSINLRSGINLVGMPLKDERVKRVSDVLELKGIKDNATSLIILDPSDNQFKIVARPGDNGDIPFTGGQSFIILAPEDGVVEITGEGWSNTFSEVVSAAPALQIPYHGESLEEVIALLERLIHPRTSSVHKVPTKTELLPNYPNPFNPETWIPYRLAENDSITLSIYDIAGAIVRKIEIGHTPAGVYESRTSAIYWDGTNKLGEKMASGVYFYTLQTNSFTATRKMLILK